MLCFIFYFSCSENAQNENERNMDDGASLLDTIFISGREAHCKEAAEALKALVPITRTVSYMNCFDQL